MESSSRTEPTNRPPHRSQTPFRSLLHVSSRTAWGLGLASFIAGEVVAAAHLGFTWALVGATVIVAFLSVVGTAILRPPDPEPKTDPRTGLVLILMLLAATPTGIWIAHLLPFGPWASAGLAGSAVVVQLLAWILAVLTQEPGHENPMDLPLTAAALLSLAVGAMPIAVLLGQEPLLVLASSPFLGSVLAASITHPFALLVLPTSVAVAGMGWQYLVEQGYPLAVAAAGAGLAVVVPGLLLFKASRAIRRLGNWTWNQRTTADSAVTTSRVSGMKPRIQTELWTPDSPGGPGRTAKDVPLEPNGEGPADVESLVFGIGGSLAPRGAFLSEYDEKRTGERQEQADIECLVDTIEHIVPPPDGDARAWRTRLFDVTRASRAGNLASSHLMDLSRLQTGFAATVEAERSMLDGWVLESALLAGLVFASGVQAASFGDEFRPAFVVLVLTALPFLSVVLLRHGMVGFYLTYDRELRFWQSQIEAARQVAAGSSEGHVQEQVGSAVGALARLYGSWDQARARRHRLSWCGNLRRLGLLMFFGGVALVLFPVTPIGALIAAAVLSAVFTVGEITDVSIRLQFSRPLQRALAAAVLRRR